jgi:FHA domain
MEKINHEPLEQQYEQLRLQTIDKLTQQLEATIGVDVEDLTGSKGAKIDLRSIKPFCKSTSPTGVDQALLAVLRVSGDEMIALVGAIDDKGGKAMFLSRIESGFERAELLGQVLPDSTINIGRNHMKLKSGELSDTVSRNHARLTVTAEGELIVEDTNSTNGTRLYTTTSDSEGVIGFHNIIVWAPKSAEVQDLLQH